MSIWPGTGSGNPTDLVPTRALLRDRSCPRVLDAIRQVRAFFPELDGVPIKVGLTRRAAGLAARDEAWIWINPYRMRRHTISHELIHLLQARGLIPGGEKSADLYALARHPVLVDDLPCYLRVPRSLRAAHGKQPGRLAGLFCRLAREAIERRTAGRRTYLRWFETELERAWRGIEEAARSETARPEPARQTLLFRA